MKPTGKALRACLVLLTLLFTSVSRAELLASVDRDRVAMGDTVRLTITATANEPVNNIDLRPLIRDFEILQRSSSSSTNIVNGKRTSSSQVILDITPKREGTLRVPSLRVGRAETNYLLLSVGPATNAAGDPLVSFEAEVDQAEVYVQGQVILTLRIQQAINLDSRSVTELQMDNAFVKPLEQKSFQRNIEGRPWLVHEIRYAIFPEQSGTLEIPAQTFTARESTQRRSLFDGAAAGKQMRRSTEVLKINVLPRPGSFTGDTWLPARKVEIQESWSTPPEQLRVGESATRKLTISGEGLQGAQLPPVLYPDTSGLKYYPDQPLINDGEVVSGLMGTRVDNVAVVPTREGTWEIPEVRIPWWDTRSGELRYAVLPARQVVVSASLDSSAPPTVAAPSGAPTFDVTPIELTSNAQTGQGWAWRFIAIFSTAGWLLTLLFFVWRRRPSMSARLPDKTEQPSEGRAFKQLIAACAGNNASQARKYLIEWCGALYPQKHVHSLDQVESLMADAGLQRQIKLMNDSLYSSTTGRWAGDELTLLLKQLRKLHRGRPTAQDDNLKLYPEPA